MSSVILSQWRERRMGVIWQDLGALTTVRARASSLVCFVEQNVRVWLCCAVCRRRAENKRLLPLVPGVKRRAADHELATLRELPSVTVQTTNALYVQKYATANDASQFLFARRFASAVYAGARCPSVCPFVTNRHCTKMVKRRITQTAPHNSPRL